MTRKLLYVTVAFALLLGVWEATYPDAYDPKNPHYVAWKWHILPMNPRRALSTMTHDAYSQRLVVGKSSDELVERFGFVKTVSQVSPYLREYCAASRPDTDVLFLNNSDYMVVMQNGRAIELVLCKG